MALNEYEKQVSFEIVGDHRFIQICTATIIERDGVEVSRTFHRKMIPPGQDVSGESAEIRSLVALFHTDEIVREYRESLPEMFRDLSPPADSEGESEFPSEEESPTEVDPEIPAEKKSDTPAEAAAEAIPPENADTVK